MLQLGSLRRLLAISLLAVLGLSFVSPLVGLGTKTGTDVPACCRRNGKHRCIMSIPDRGNLSDYAPVFSAPPENCPYHPVSVAIVHGDTFAPPTAQAVYAGLFAHPAIVAQTESKLRISLGRARQKRGPPLSSSI